MGKIFHGIKYIYKKMPISEELKIKFKGIFYNMFGFCLKNNKAYREWRFNKNRSEILAKQLNTGVFEFDAVEAKKFEFSGRIAVHLHLFYVDLLEEFIGYFNNIPYKFDLFISMIDKDKSDYVRVKCAAITNAGKIVIKAVENRGRDVAPLISLFGKDILDYDYFLHVHSKKSLFTGNEQMNWRKHLLENLMGSENFVRSIFYCFEHGNKVGMIYPETFETMPYWGHTWLQNEAARDELLGRIDVPWLNSGKYIDYPMGTMFWGRVSALRQFFDAKIAVDEFAEEKGQTDGTIAHAFERCTVVVCHNNDYNILIYDDVSNRFVYNNGRKNFDQYFVKSFDKLKDMVSDYGIVSFDIFDTLISRDAARPSDAFELLENKLKCEHKYDIPFAKLRAEAEKLWREKNKGLDCNIDDIYGEFEKISQLDKASCEIIKNAEIENELALIYPKAEMVDIYNKIAGRQEVILISDMYLRKKDIVKILDRCGIKNYKEILLSNELNLRKDDKSFWAEYAKKYSTKKWLHIGDNEVSDIQISGDYGITSYHILNKADLFNCSNIGDYYNLAKISNSQTSVAVGLVLKKLFDNPFRWNENMLNVKITDEQEFGYSVVAPAVLAYMNNLYINIVKSSINKVFFFAREGWLLKQLFDISKEFLPSLLEVEGIYLNVSRRALSVAALKDKQDVEELTDIAFKGSFNDFLNRRFGINDNNALKEAIHLPGDEIKVQEMMEGYLDEILIRADRERDNYLKYYNSIRGNKNKRAAVSDIGYSGTIQYYLSKLTGETYDGYYFATDSKQKPLKIEGNTIHGYYIENDEYQNLSRSVIHRYHLLLESVLIAPAGQLLYIDDEGNCVYTEDKNSCFTDGIKAVHEGVKEYFRDFYRVCGQTALLADVDTEFAENMIKAAVEKNIVGENIEKILKTEDFYCSDGEISVLEHFRNIKETDNKG